MYLDIKLRLKHPSAEGVAARYMLVATGEVGESDGDQFVWHTREFDSLRDAERFYAHKLTEYDGHWHDNVELHITEVD